MIFARVIRSALFMHANTVRLKDLRGKHVFYDSGFVYELCSILLLLA